MLEGIRGRVSSRHAFPVNTGGFGMSLLMPSRPAAIVPAYARYGLVSAPGMRLSSRYDGPCPTSRNAQDRLSCPTAIAVPANRSGTYRLYELMVGAYIRPRSIEFVNWPETNAPNRSDMPSSAQSSGDPSVSDHRLKWRWQEDPTSSMAGFAMKLAVSLFFCASSLMPCLNRTCRSAI